MIICSSIILCTLFLVLALRRKTKDFTTVFLISFAALIIFQFLSTRLASVYEFSAFQQYQHLFRLNQYPPALARLGNITENHLETPIFYRLRQNLFDSLDFADIFKNYLHPLLFLPFLIGLYKFFRHPPQIFLWPLLFALLELTLIGPKGHYGPLVLLPFYLALIFYFPFEK